MIANDNNTAQNVIEALAQCNGKIPSLYNLVVESIRTFVNPGIEELKRVFLQVSEENLSRNNELRCIAEESIEERLVLLQTDIDHVNDNLVANNIRLERLEDKLTVIYDFILEEKQRRKRKREPEPDYNSDTENALTNIREAFENNQEESIIEDVIAFPQLHLGPESPPNTPPPRIPVTERPPTPYYP